MLLPSSASNPANMVAQALSIYKNLVVNGDARVKDSLPDSTGNAPTGVASKGSPATPRSSDAASNTRTEGSGFSLQSSKKVE